MLVDPVTVAAASPTPELKMSVVRSDGYGSERNDSGGNGYTIVTNHSKGKASDRHYVQVIQTKDVTNPYSGLLQTQSCSASFTINRPKTGFSDADTVALAKVLTDYLADSEVTVARIIQFES